MLFGKSFTNKNIYRLKTMAMVRVISEVSALLIFLALPFFLLLTGSMTGLDLVVKIAVVIGAVFALLVLPAYGFITWQMHLTESGLECWSLIRKRKLGWESLKKLTRKSNFNWQRYVLEYDGGDVTFPLWFERLDSLVEAIRQRLPADLSPLSAQSVPREFRLDTISYSMQLSQVCFGLVLSGVAAYFAAHLLAQNNTSIWDSLLVIVFTLVLSLSMLFRALAVALSPRKIVLDGDAIELETIFYKKRILWEKVESLKASSPLLPEGFMLQTQEGSFLIGSGFNSIDELLLEAKNRKSKLNES